jgi:hypothetical protein
MRWSCQRDGCFNIKRRPKIEVFAECFPRRINFGDVDGLVELNGRFCLLEWKGEGGTVKFGQAMSYTNFTKIPGNVVFVVDGNAETMEITRYTIFWGGKRLPAVAADLAGLKDRIRRWAQQTTTRSAAAE